LLVEEEQKNIIANNEKKGKEAMTEGIILTQSRRSIEKRIIQKEGI